MAVVLAAEPMQRELLTNSKMQLLKNCPMKFNWRVEKQLVSRHRSEALTIGSAFHLGVEKQSVDAAMAAFDDIYPNNQHEADQLEIQKATVRAMVGGYLTLFAGDDFDEILPEIEFQLPIINPETGATSRSFVLAGKMDGLVCKGNRWALLELKTTGQRPSESYIGRLPLDTQVTTYFYAARRLGYPVTGVTYRIAIRPFIRQRKNETVAEFCDRLEADYQERPEFYFVEERLFRSDDDLEQFERELWHVTQDLLYRRRHGLWYKNTSRCAEWGGCEYLPLCRGEEGAEVLYTTESPTVELSQGGDA